MSGLEKTASIDWVDFFSEISNVSETSGASKASDTEAEAALTPEATESVSEAEDSNSSTPAPRLWSLFAKYHADNPNVWKLFHKYTFDVIRAGRTRFGARDIVHRIRWYTNIETSGDEFKINNNWSPYYGRIFMALYPQHNALFETRNVEDDPETLANIVRQLQGSGVSTDSP